MKSAENANTITAREFYEMQVVAFLDFLEGVADNGEKITDGNEELFDILTEWTGATTDSFMAKMLYCFVGGFLKGFEVADDLISNN